MSQVNKAVLTAAAVLCLVGGGTSAAVAGSGGSSVTATKSVRASSSAAATSTSAAVRLRWGRPYARDEFSYRGAPNSAKWKVYSGRGHRGHGRRSPKAWHVNGHSAIVTGNSAGVTGGMKAKFAHQKYGRWEVRMRTNARDSQYHAAVLLWPDRREPVRCPEVDFAEGLRNTHLVKFFLHYGCAPKQTSAVKRVDTTRWHNYAVEWTPRHVFGYVDGVRYFSDTNRRHVPRVSMHQTLQLDWFPRSNAKPKTSQMWVSYVRAYRLK